jgi:hypothetical protein
VPLDGNALNPIIHSLLQVAMIRSPARHCLIACAARRSYGDYPTKESELLVSFESRVNQELKGISYADLKKTAPTGF